MPPPSQAEHSPDNSRLWYSDPTGTQAVRNLTPGSVTVTWPDGFTVWLTENDAKPLLGFLRRYYAFQMSRKFHVWGKKKALSLNGVTAPNVQTRASKPNPTITQEKDYVFSNDTTRPH